MTNIMDDNISGECVDFCLEPVEDIMNDIQGLGISNGRIHPHVMPHHMPHWMPHHPSHIGPGSVMAGGQIHHSQMTPGTPPDTPPGSSPNTGSLTPSPHFQCSLVQQHTFMDEKTVWVNPAYVNPRYHTQEPLDLRPGPPCITDQLENHSWVFDRKYDLVGHHRNLSPLHSGGKSQSHYGNQPPLTPLHDPHDTLPKITDNELTQLSVRELNKKLHNMNKDLQAKYKQRRRTLKNRGYAQSCRYKRQSYKTELESVNDHLKDENQELRQRNDSLLKQLDKAKQELDLLKRNLQQPSSVQNQHQHLHKQHQHQHQQQQQQQQNPLCGIQEQTMFSM